MALSEQEASELLRTLIREGERGDNPERAAALAYLDYLERNYLDTKAQRDEDDHPSLIKLISLRGTSADVRIFAGSQAVSMVRSARLELRAGQHYPAILYTESIDTGALRSGGVWVGASGPPMLAAEIPLRSFVFRGVRG